MWLLMKSENNKNEKSIGSKLYQNSDVKTINPNQLNFLIGNLNDFKV